MPSSRLTITGVAHLGADVDDHRLGGDEQRRPRRVGDRRHEHVAGLEGAGSLGSSTDPGPARAPCRGTGDAPEHRRRRWRGRRRRRPAGASRRVGLLADEHERRARARRAPRSGPVLRHGVGTTRVAEVGRRARPPVTSQKSSSRRSCPGRPAAAELPLARRPSWTQADHVVFDRSRARRGTRAAGRRRRGRTGPGSPGRRRGRRRAGRVSASLGRDAAAAGRGDPRRVASRMPVDGGQGEAGSVSHVGDDASPTRWARGSRTGRGSRRSRLTKLATPRRRRPRRAVEAVEAGVEVRREGGLRRPRARPRSHSAQGGLRPTRPRRCRASSRSTRPGRRAFRAELAERSRRGPSSGTWCRCGWPNSGGTRHLLVDRAAQLASVDVVVRVRSGPQPRGRYALSASRSGTPRRRRADEGLAIAERRAPGRVVRARPVRRRLGLAEEDRSISPV